MGQRAWLRSLLLIAVITGTPAVAAAGPIWFWSFDDTLIEVHPSDSIVLRATLFVSPFSPEPITRVDGASFTGDLQKSYNFTFGDFSQFAGLDVVPGESFGFVVGTLTPIGGAVAPGVYPFCCGNEASWGFGSPTEMDPLVPVTNTFTIEVQQVPEPPPVMLLALGIALLGASTRRQRRPRENLWS